MKKLLILLILLLIFWAIATSHTLFPNFNLNNTPLVPGITEKTKIASEESAVINAIDTTLPSVVTIGISKTSSTRGLFEFDPFNPFQPFQQTPGTPRKIEQNIGSGFVIANDGLIVTNKHVVADTEATYKVLTNDNKEYQVVKISRDSLNDLAILKIDAKNLKPIALGDSNNLKLGQSVIAIGTPLGEFTNTVTSGIISGLKRGITAGSPFENYVERLDNVIQTDAAISPGNSGGPLVNLHGQAIGVNTAVSQEGQNIGFAIPINVVKDLIKTFNSSGGKIERPFLGVRYQMIDRQTAIINKLPEGAYIIEVVDGSPAQASDIQKDDIITDVDGQRIKGGNDQTLQKIVAKKRVGDRVILKLWRDGKTLEKTITLQNFE